MKTAAVLLSLALATAPVTALQVSGNVLTLSEEEVAHCSNEGGCVFITREALYKAVEEMAKNRAGDCMGSVNRKGIV